MRDRVVVFISFLVLLVYFFMVFKTNFEGPDQPIYYAYTESMAEDGDLNVINNIDPKNQFYFPSGVKSVSKTYNLPDFHGHGGIVLWIPFYQSAKYLFSLSLKFKLSDLSKNQSSKITKCFMSFSTVVFGFFTLLLTFLLCRMFFSSAISLFSTIIICFGTPFFYFLLYEVGNAQILASLFSVLSILAVAFIIRMKRSHWFIYGLFFGICIVVKADLWAQVFFIILLFLFLVKTKQTTWTNGCFFILGIIPSITLKSINDYLKYGTFHVGETGILNFGMSYLKEMLFSSYRGYLYTSPILYICLAGLILAATNYSREAKKLNLSSTNNEASWRDLFIILLSSYLVIKVFIISHTYAWGGGTPGARVLLTEFPIFVLLYARTLSCKNSFMKILIYIASIIFVFWNILLISEFMLGVDLEYALAPPNFISRLQSFKKALNTLFQFKDIDLKLYFCLFIVPIISSILCYMIIVADMLHPSQWHNRKHKSKIGFLTLSIAAIYLNICYAQITFLNVTNNKINVDRLKNSGLFTNIKILSKKDFERRENLGAMKEMIDYFTYKGNKQRAYQIKESIKNLYGNDQF